MTDRLTTQEKYDRYVNTSFVKGIEPVVFETAQGATITAQDGRQYVDLYAGVATVNAGHRNPKVVEAAREQLDRYIHSGTYVYYSPPVADLAEALAAISPGRLQKTFFANSGAEAVEGALRVAKAYTGKRELVALQMGFHGRSNAALSVTGNALRKTHGGPYMAGVAFAPAPYQYRCRICNGRCNLGCADALEDTIKFSTSRDVAAFIAEAIMGEGGIIIPPEGYFERVKDILDKYEILFIDDEVQSGFGRTGKMFGIEHYNVQPDIMTMAKGIADGFPLSAVIASPEIADSLRPGEHFSTFGGNPVSCAAAIANVRVMIEDRLPQHAGELGEWAMGRLRQMAEQHHLIGDVRGLGLLIGVELVKSRETKEPATQQAAEIRRYCREHGVLIGVGGQESHILRIQPPLVIERDQLDHALNVIEEAFASVAVAA